MNIKKQEQLAAIWKEYESGRQFKSGLGSIGLYEQNRRNERFYVGDQWHGAKCGGERPLVRHNVIKRIGEYKMAVIGSAPIAVNYSAEGITQTQDAGERIKDYRLRASQGEQLDEMFTPTAAPDADRTDRINLIMSALSSYFDTTAERVKFDKFKEQVLRDAYIAGTSYLYTYWDPDVRTGLYADAERNVPIDGDVAIEQLDVENVYMGAPNSQDIQSQPYILIVQRHSLKSLRTEARRNGISEAEIDMIKPDEERAYTAGDRSQDEPVDVKKATVITRLWKKKHKDGHTTVRAVRVCHGCVIRREWDLRIRLYPLAAFSWLERKGCAYGDSEITYLIPNQIAINRMITASVWAVMTVGMPITVVNGDVVQQPITNDPGQVLRVYGSTEDVASAIRYVNPPNFSPKFDDLAMSLINNTLTQSGASDAALGDMRPENTSAIIAVREAATMPMQLQQNRFHDFVEDFARILAEFWATNYHARPLKISDDQGVWYMPFDGQEIADLIVTAKIDVGAAGLWSESQSIATLDNLLSAQIITPLQYLERLPNGTVKDLHKLIEALKAKEAAVQTPMQETPDMSGIVDMLSPEYQQQLASLPEEQAQQLITSAISSQTP